MSIRWITPLLGTAPASLIDSEADVTIVDVRNLVDKAGNSVDVVSEKIQEGVESLVKGMPTVICCDYGMSRSNAIATGVLAKFEKIEFDAALRRVLDATGEREIKLQPLSAVRAALGERPAREEQRSQRSVLVTGGNGFLGKAVRIAGGDEFGLTIPTRSEVDISLGSTQLSLLANEKEVDCIVHLANPRVYTSNIALGQSLTMLRNVIDVCLANDIKLIYPSCWEVYSGYTGLLTADESTSALPRGPYGEAKYLAERLIESCRKTEGLRCMMLRPGVIYGPGGDKPKFIYRFIDKARRSETVFTHQYNNGAPSLDLLYVDDFVAALLLALRTDFVGDLNIGTGQLTSTKKIAQLIIKKLGSSSLIKPVPIDAEVASVALDCRRAREVLDWRPILNVEDGLDRVLSEIS